MRAPFPLLSNITETIDRYLAIYAFRISFICVCLLFTDFRCRSKLLRCVWGQVAISGKYKLPRNKTPYLRTIHLKYPPAAFGELKAKYTLFSLTGVGLNEVNKRPLGGA